MAEADLPPLPAADLPSASEALAALEAKVKNAGIPEERLPLIMLAALDPNMDFAKTDRGQLLRELTLVSTSLTDLQEQALFKDALTRLNNFNERTEALQPLNAALKRLAEIEESPAADLQEKMRQANAMTPERIQELTRTSLQRLDAYDALISATRSEALVTETLKKETPEFIRLTADAWVKTHIDAVKNDTIETIRSDAQDSLERQTPILRKLADEAIIQNIVDTVPIMDRLSAINSAEAQLRKDIERAMAEGSRGMSADASPEAKDLAERQAVANMLKGKAGIEDPLSIPPAPLAEVEPSIPPLSPQAAAPTIPLNATLVPPTPATLPTLQSQQAAPLTKTQQFADFAVEMVRTAPLSSRQNEPAIVQKAARDFLGIKNSDHSRDAEVAQLIKDANELPIGKRGNEFRAASTNVLRGNDTVLATAARTSSQQAKSAPQPPEEPLTYSPYGKLRPELEASSAVAAAHANGRAQIGQPGLVRNDGPSTAKLTKGPAHPEELRGEELNKYVRHEMVAAINGISDPIQMRQAATNAYNQAMRNSGTSFRDPEQHFATVVASQDNPGLNPLRDTMGLQKGATANDVKFAMRNGNNPAEKELALKSDATRAARNDPGKQLADKARAFNDALGRNQRAEARLGLAQENKKANPTKKSATERFTAAVQESRIMQKIFPKAKQELMAAIAGSDGDASSISATDMDNAAKLATNNRAVALALGLNPNSKIDAKQVGLALKSFSKQHDIPVIASNDPNVQAPATQSPGAGKSAPTPT